MTPRPDYIPVKTGRTQRMIDELVEAVVEGQPRSLVVAVTEHNARDISSRVLDALSTRGMVVGVCERGRRLEVEGSTIWFAGRDRVIGRHFAGVCGLGEFWDHAALQRVDSFTHQLIDRHFAERDAREAGCGTMTYRFSTPRYRNETW